MDSVAVIGMAGRFPGAQDLNGFWENLAQGVCSIVPLSDEQLDSTLTERERNHPRFVNMAASVDNPGHFDAGFFRIYPKEAKVIDPQHRLFLECSWEALEDAGYVPGTYSGAIGVFAGCYLNTYVLSSLSTNPEFIGALADSFHGGLLLNELGSDKDYLATRVSYKLNLTGPSLTIQTACSTSLVAVIQACTALITHQCDMALAGASSLKLPQDRGYVADMDGMVSPDGIIRTFDEKAQGTVFGNGVGVVLLKRLQEAIDDADPIYAVIKGWGLNNDGAQKTAYASPSLEGQRDAILRAMKCAGVSPRSISYVEAHGTGTSKGDPIEVEALSQAFASETEDTQFCRIGSVKPNIGHLDVAAGVAGLIKTILALNHKQIPPSLHCDSPNPAIGFERTPFKVNTALEEWDSIQFPRRAGVSSFGVGGTNAHVIVEEAPESTYLRSTKPFHILPLSARSSTGAEAMLSRLRNQLRSNPDLDLADVAYTLQQGRKSFTYTRFLVANSLEDAESTLGGLTGAIHSGRRPRNEREIVFMFPGQGAQHPGMGKDVYESEPVYKAAIDQCAEIAQEWLGVDLRKVLYSSSERNNGSDSEINQTSLAQPGLFATCYALAHLWKSRGVEPSACIGHSAGEFVAACLAGVFALEDALKLVALRGQIMQNIPGGAMIAVRAPVEEIQAYLGDRVDVAAINSHALCVLSGSYEAISETRRRLEDLSIVCQPLHTSHAFHSAMMDPAVSKFTEVIEHVSLHEPRIPIMSTVYADWLTAEQAVNPGYWASHLRETVRFGDAVAHVARDSNYIFLEVGPGQTLSTLARQNQETKDNHLILSSLPHAQKDTSDYKYFLESTGKLWQSGIDVDWSSLYDGEQRRRVHLPTYPFERKRFWFDENPSRPISARNGIDSVETLTSPQKPPFADNDHRSLIDQQLQLMSVQIQSWRDQLKD